jgi:hypothetical protein
MSQFILGTSVHVFDPPEGSLVNELPARIYTVQQNPISGVFYLDYGVNLPEQLPKHYGDLNERAERIMRTYLARNKSTGVALTGFKGTGKSLLAREVCRNALTAGMPIIMVNKCYGGEEFCTFIASIKQKAVILFEEFDKVYGGSHAEDDDEDENKSPVNSILSLLDGLYNSDKLYLFTSNSLLPYYLHNRPSRVFYHYEYDAVLNEEIVKGYCENNLSADAMHCLEDIVLMASVSYEFSFDMLQAIVEEVNRFPNTKLSELVKAVNVDAQLTSTQFNMKFIVDNGDGIETDVSELFDDYPISILDGTQHYFDVSLSRNRYTGKFADALPKQVRESYRKYHDDDEIGEAKSVLVNHLDIPHYCGEFYLHASDFKHIGNNTFKAQPTSKLAVYATASKANGHNRYAY